MISYSNTTREQDRTLDDARNSVVGTLETLAEEWNRTLGELAEARDRISELERQVDRLEEVRGYR
jgi:chromosome segregation ATPase